MSNDKLEATPGMVEVSESHVIFNGEKFTREQWESVVPYMVFEEPQPADYDQQMISQAAEGFDYLLDRQAGVEKAWGRMVNIGDDEAVSKYISEVILCVTDELHEVLAEVNWKPWKKSRGIKNLENYREEMADVLHFILDLYLAAGMSGFSIVVDYIAKNTENLDRVTRTEYLES